MAWLELTVSTVSSGIEKAANLLTAGGFEDLVLEDQAEFEAFLDENRAYWDYIDEDLQEKLQGLSNIKLYLGGLACCDSWGRKSWTRLSD